MASIRIGTTAELALIYATGTNIEIAFVGDDTWAWDPGSQAAEDANTLGTWEVGRWRLGILD